MGKMFVIRVPSGQATGECRSGPDGPLLEFDLDARPGEFWSRPSGEPDALWERRRIHRSIPEGATVMLSCYPGRLQ